ncbi:glycine cleavage system protein R [Ningiella sp. W23]|uniref:glycine cleavage system protein R n=1 Tax=Ningiella sp. W23 TaxID=3023715 RepID=UPI0037565902
MKTQLIVNVLGADKLGILSLIASKIRESNCNILDSRHAIYGQDFSITMIINGTENEITRLEVSLSSFCVEHELLCMMKRTSGHIKQNIEQLITLKFSGRDRSGIIQQITSVLAGENVSVNAMRQKITQKDDVCYVEGKMILSAPADLDLVKFDRKLKQSLSNYGLSGQISHQINKEDNEYIESW